MEKYTFGELFKLFRLRAGIETLSSFANMMAEHGMVYENSLYSRWQRNERIPRDRKVIIIVAQILNKHKGVTTKEEVNLLLESADQRELTETEAHQFIFTTPPTAHTEPAVPKSEKIPTLLTVIKQALLKSKATYLIFALFTIQTLLFIWVWQEQLYGTFQAYFIGYTYGYIALSGIYYGLSYLNKCAGSSLSCTIRWLSFGLLSQFIGLQIWTAYNLQGIDVPYPSIADFGYFGLIPCYLYATLNVTNPQLARKIGVAFKKNLLAVLTPPIMICAAMLTYFSLGRGFSLDQHLGDMLAVVFLVGEIIPITLLLYTFIFGNRTKNRLSQYAMGAMLLGFFLQFLAEYSFIFSASLGAYVNTNAIDYIYCISYTYMALVIVMLTNTNKLYNSNVALDEIPSSKQNQNSNRLLSILNPFQN